MANEFVITEHRCEMCKCYGHGATTKMVLSNGKVIAKFHLCGGCIQEMLDTYKDVINEADVINDAENESLKEENKKLVFALSEAVQKQGFRNLNIPESLTRSMEKIAEERGENRKYIEQLRSEVDKWHHAYDALLVERNALAHELHNIKKTMTEK